MAPSSTLSAWQTFWQMSGAAFAMLVLLGLAIQAVLIIAPLKWFQLKRLLRHERRFEQALEQVTDDAQLGVVAASHPGAPGARVLAYMTRVHHLRPSSYQDLLGSGRRAIVEEQKICSRLMPTLSSIASTAPLLGLFGTVWGIIEAFLKISAEKSSELPVIAPAMSGALLTTALGLLAAMPASVVYNHTSAIVENLLDQLDSLAQSWAGRLAVEGP